MRTSASQRRPDVPVLVTTAPPRTGTPDAGPAATSQPDGCQHDSGQPGGCQHDSGQPGAGSPAEVLDALCAGAQRLLGAAEHPPARLKLAAAGASVELEWPLPGAIPAASAAPTAITAGAATAPTLAAGSAGRAAAGSDGASAGTAPAGTAPSAGTAPPGGTVPSAGTAQLCIRAPMVGTFYHAPEPGSAPFVRPGDVVDAGQQVGILEVMKLMTPVEADRRATVVEFLVPDAAAVEHGQPLISCAAA